MTMTDEMPLKDFLAAYNATRPLGKQLVYSNALRLCAVGKLPAVKRMVKLHGPNYQERWFVPSSALELDI